MAYSTNESHNSTFGCRLELGFTGEKSVYPTTVVEALGRGCLDPYTLSRDGKGHSGQTGGYEASDAHRILGEFKNTHQAVEVTPSRSLDRVAPELGMLMAAEVAQDTEMILDDLSDQGLRDAGVAASLDAAADVLMPKYEA